MSDPASAAANAAATSGSSARRGSARADSRLAHGDELKLAFGPVGLAGWALLVIGILARSRVLAFLGLAGVAADVTIAELGGFKAMNESRSAGAGDAVSV